MQIGNLDFTIHHFLSDANIVHIILLKARYTITKSYESWHHFPHVASLLPIIVVGVGRNTNSTNNQLYTAAAEPV